MLVHSGQKDFACPFCSYITYVTHNLRKHCLTKHKVRVFYPFIFVCIFMPAPLAGAMKFSVCLSVRSFVCYMKMDKPILMQIGTSGPLVHKDTSSSYKSVDCIGL